MLLVLLLCIEFPSVSNSAKTDLVPRSVKNLRKLTADQRRARIYHAELVSGVTKRNPYLVQESTTVSSFSAASSYFQDARRQADKKNDPKAGANKTGKVPTTKFEPAAVKNQRLKEKAYSLMQQFLFASQERMWPLEKLLQRYQHLWPFRMAFLFGQLQLLVHDAASIVGQEAKVRKQDASVTSLPLSTTKRAQIYWALMRRNIDGSYLVDYLLSKVPIANATLKIIGPVLRKEKEDIERMLRQKKT